MGLIGGKCKPVFSSTKAASTMTFAEIKGSWHFQCDSQVRLELKLLKLEYNLSSIFLSITSKSGGK